jgi:hypothetical protein
VHRAPRIVSLAGLLAAEAAAAATLRRLGRVPGFALPHHGIGRWALHAPTEDLFAVSARLIGLGLAWWMVAATALSIARRVVPGCRRLRALDAVTPAGLRNALDRALAFGIGASLGLASVHPAGATTLDVPVLRVPTPVTTLTVPAATAAPTQPPTAPGVAEAVVVVRPGDNLWLIATRALRGAGQPTGASEVAPYWGRIIAANTAHLRSRDPNLIFPGERIVLPPNDAARG